MYKLTKSKFKLGMECPSKIYYSTNKSFTNQSNDDSFLQSLADGGFQVEKYVRDVYFGRQGHVLTRSDKENDLALTNGWLQEENTLIFEAAIAVDNMLVYVDVLEKKGDVLNMYEIKAKSSKGLEDFEKEALGKKKIPNILKKWRPYMWDIAFQKHVLKLAYPDFQVNANLIITDKSKATKVDGLNQLYRVTRYDERRIEVQEPQLSDVGADKENPIVQVINVDDILDERIYTENGDTHNGLSFSKTLYKCKGLATSNIPVENSTLSLACKKCEFVDDKHLEKSGWHKCWNQIYSLEKLKEPKSYDVWYSVTEEVFKGKNFMSELKEGDYEVPTDSPQFNRKKRQWAQIESYQKGLDDHYLMAGLESALAELKFPLNFIDFETSMAALPFFKGLRPYEQIGFQFSHHILHEDGRVVHQTQYLNATPGEFPNFDFVRKLRDALIQNEGSILRYSNHENTILDKIHDQLSMSNESDKNELMVFIESITHKDGRPDGPRDMVDLCDLVVKYWYHPSMAGSNSIKSILPASIKTSRNLQTWLQQPMNKAGITSLNDPNHQWLTKEQLDPYESLLPVFNGMTNAELNGLTNDELNETVNMGKDQKIKNGGAAMAAYAILQYTDVSTIEREQIESALLRYCELDTLAMIVVYKRLVQLLED